MPTVLIVEDEPNVRRLYEMELEREGFHVESVASGEQCLACLEQTNPDLVVLDVMMPGMDGIETLQQLRTRKRSVRVVLNTACTACSSNYLSWAADEFLIKSSDTSELIKTVKRLA